MCKSVITLLFPDGLTHKLTEHTFLEVEKKGPLTASPLLPASPGEPTGPGGPGSP